MKKDVVRALALVCGSWARTPLALIGGVYAAGGLSRFFAHLASYQSLATWRAASVTLSLWSWVRSLLTRFFALSSLSGIVRPSRPLLDVPGAVPS